MPDGWEVSNSFNPLDDDANEDPDNDDLTNIGEYTAGTDPHDFDSDDDGYTDFLEVTEGTDPNDPNDFPAVTVTPPPETITITPTNETITITVEAGMIISSVIITSTLGIAIAVIILRKRRKLI